MMGDLVDEHVADDVAQCLLVIGPVIEDRPAIEEDHIGERACAAELLAMGKPHAVEQAEQLEFIPGLHGLEDVVRRKIRDPDDDVAGDGTKLGRQTRIGIRRKRFQVLERRRFEAVQFMQRKPVAWQRSNPSAVIALTVV